MGAGYCLIRGLQGGRTRWGTLTGVLLGLGFIPQMGQALSVLPAFGRAYLLAAPTSLRRRIADLLAAGVALVAGVGWWVAIVELWPASARPYIGGSTDNSILQLAFGCNGLAMVATGLVVGGTLASTGITSAATSTVGTAAASMVDQTTAIRSDEHLLTGATASKVKALAVAKYPAATVERVETDSDGVDEAHVRLADGSQLIVQVGKDSPSLGSRRWAPRPRAWPARRAGRPHCDGGSRLQGRGLAFAPVSSQPVAYPIRSWWTAVASRSAATAKVSCRCVNRCVHPSVSAETRAARAAHSQGSTMTPAAHRTRYGVLTGAVTLTALLALGSSGAAVASEQERGHAERGGGPDVSLTSAVEGDTLAPGNGKPGAGSPAGGSGFVINVEAKTHGRAGIAVNEALNIRNTALLGQPNPKYPGLVVTVDNDLTKPDGGVIPAGTNLAALFNIAGTDDSRGPGVTVWAGWHVLESLAPGTTRLTVTAAVTDVLGRTGIERQTYRVAPSGAGQALTPAPTQPPAAATDGAGPELELSAPEHPSSVATGTLPQPNAKNGTLFFIQLDALDRAHHGIGVDENVGGRGTIATPAAIPAGVDNSLGGVNPNVPGLHFSFDAGLRQPNGHLVAAGQNLAPLFNIAGSATGPDGAVRTTLDWVVGGSLVLPAGQHTVTMTATVTDNAGAQSTTHQTVGISPATSGQDLTPQP